MPQGLFDPLAVGDITDNHRRFLDSRDILVKRAGNLTEKRRAILPLVEQFPSESPGALSLLQKRLQSIVGRIHKAEPGDATDLFRAASEEPAGSWVGSFDGSIRSRK